MRKGVGKTVQARQLGRLLRDMRKESGFSVDDAATELGLSAPTLYRFETGTSVPRPPDVRTLCEVYGVKQEMAEALMALAKEAELPGWWHSFNGAIPKWFSVFISLESTADHIRVYDAELVTGILQTRDYAEATYREAEPRPTPAEQEQGVSVRMRRQRLLDRKHPPRLDVIIGEAALSRPVGGSAVMAGQLERLDAMSRLPHVSLRVMPASQPHPAALGAGARFTLLTFPDGRNSEPPTVYTESLCGALYLSKPAEFRAYDRVWDATYERALPPAESRVMIQKYRGEYLS